MSPIILTSIIAIIVSGAAVTGYYVRLSITDKKLKNAEVKKASMIKDAKRESDKIIERADYEHKNILKRARKESEDLLKKHQRLHSPL